MPLSPKWTGPLCCVVGVAAMSVQVYLYFYGGLLSSWLLGGGFAMILLGGVSWFHYLDDSLSSSHRNSKDEFPTAEEYDRQFQEVDPFDADAI